jgi:Fe-S-cluster containining protein
MIDLEGVPECVRCGACCFSSDERYLQVLEGDYERLAEDAERLTRNIDDQVYMRLVEGHCAALNYDRETGNFMCSVYARRPDVCHWLQRGSGQCNVERTVKSELPLNLARRSS